MRAQFATIEALLSLVIVASAVSIVSGGLTATTMNYNTRRDYLQRQMVLYDFANLLEHNTSANDCASSLYTSGQAPCMDSLTSTYAQALGVRELYVSASNVSSSNSAANSTELCTHVSLYETNLTGSFCLIATS